MDRLAVGIQMGKEASWKRGLGWLPGMGNGPGRGAVVKGLSA